MSETAQPLSTVKKDEVVAVYRRTLEHHQELKKAQLQKQN